MKLNFDERSPLSAIDEMRKHSIYAGALQNDEEPNYKLADESFAAYVPAKPSPDGNYGLIVFAAPGAGDPPAAWIDVLNKHHLIWVTPINLFQEGHYVFRRQGLLLDAVHNMKQKYKIDDSRVYLAGFSGGGLMAADFIHAYPDLFKGVISMNGDNYYSLHEVRDQAFNYLNWKYEPTVIEKAQWEGDLDQLKTSLHIVMLAGEKDKFAPPGISRANKESLEMDGFVHVSVFVAPGGDHRLPSATYFEKCVTALEDTQPSTPPSTQPSDLENLPPSQLAQAKRLLSSALSMLDQCKPEQRKSTQNFFIQKASKYLDQLINDFPKSAPAKQAADLKDQIKSGKLPATQSAKVRSETH